MTAGLTTAERQHPEMGGLCLLHTPDPLLGKVTGGSGRTHTKSDVKVTVNAGEADDCRGKDFQKATKTTWETVSVLSLSFTLQKGS